MLDKQSRVTLRKEIISKSKYGIKKEVNLFYDPKEKNILIRPKEDVCVNGMYFLISLNIDSKTRLFIPKILKQAFPDSTFIPAEKDGEIYILIIKNEKKSE